MNSTSPAQSAVGVMPSQSLGELDVLRRDEWSPDVELDLGVRKQGDLTRVSGEHSSVEECGDVAASGPDPLTVEWLSPDVEEVAERVRPLDGGFGVDDPVGRMRMQPHEAG